MIELRFVVLNGFLSLSLLVKSIISLRVVPHFSPGIVERAKRERGLKSPHSRKGYMLFLRRVIFTRARVSLALLSLRRNGGLLVV